MIIFFDGSIILFFLVLSLLGAGSIITTVSKFLANYIWITIPIIFILIYIKNFEVLDISYHDKKYDKFNKLFFVISSAISFMKYFYMFIFIITFLNMLGDSRGIEIIVTVPLSAVGAFMPMIVLSVSEWLDMFLLSKFDDMHLMVDRTKILTILFGFLFMAIVAYFCSFFIIKYTLNMMPDTYDALFSNSAVNYWIEIITGK